MTKTYLHQENLETWLWFLEEAGKSEYIEFVKNFFTKDLKDKDWHENLNRYMTKLVKGNYEPEDQKCLLDIYYEVLQPHTILD